MELVLLAVGSELFSNLPVYVDSSFSTPVVRIETLYTCTPAIGYSWIFPVFADSKPTTSNDRCTSIKGFSMLNIQ